MLCTIVVGLYMYFRRCSTSDSLQLRLCSSCTLWKALHLFNARLYVHCRPQALGTVACSLVYSFMVTGQINVSVQSLFGTSDHIRLIGVV